MNAWAFKLFAAVLLTACCALGGHSLNARERRRVELLSSLRRAMPMLSIEMLERLTPLEAALQRSAQPLLTYIAGAMARGMGAREAWILEKDDLTRRGGMLDCAQKEDLQRLDLLFENLGASGVSAQKLLLRESESAFGSLLQQAQKRAQERGKLYTNLGLLLGLAISVCLL